MSRLYTAVMVIAISQHNFMHYIGVILVLGDYVREVNLISYLNNLIRLLDTLYNVRTAFNINYVPINLPFFIILSIAN